MTKYMCLVSGEVFEEETDAALHTNKKHNLSLDDAIHNQELMITLDDDADPEKAYTEWVERSE